MPTQKSLKLVLALLNLHQHAKNQLFLMFILEIQQILEPVTRLFLTMPTKTFFDQLLIYVNFYHHAKNQVISLICSGNIIDLKILQSVWLRTFWPLSQE